MNMVNVLNVVNVKTEPFGPRPIPASGGPSLPLDAWNFAGGCGRRPIWFARVPDAEQARVPPTEAAARVSTAAGEAGGVLELNPITNASARPKRDSQYLLKEKGIGAGRHADAPDSASLDRRPWQMGL